MERDFVVSSLRQHKAQLKAAGIVHLRLFGSVARGDRTIHSHIDLLFDCDPYSLVQVYGSEDEVGAMLGAKVHLSCSRNLRPEFRDQIFAETIDVF